MRWMILAYTSLNGSVIENGRTDPDWKDDNSSVGGVMLKWLSGEEQPPNGGLVCS